MTLWWWWRTSPSSSPSSTTSSSSSSSLSSRSRTSCCCCQLWTVVVLLMVVAVQCSSGSSSSSRSSVVLHTRELSVKVGRAVYLSRDDLHVGRTRRGEDCRVEVVMADPITQRVGHMDPPIFDCHFLPRTVQYIHNGSPLLSSDRVKLRVHRFTPSDTLTETVHLTVKVVNASHDVVDVRGLRPVVVPEFNGLSNAIDASSIRFRNSSNANVSCTISFSKFYSPWPLVGHIVMGGERRQVVDSVKKDCREFLFMNLHYEHLRSPTPEVDYLPLTVELFDSSVSEDVVSERYYLPIYIKGALPNSPPHASFINRYMMDVDQFVLSTIIPGVISAEDYETPKGQLVFNISKPFEEGRGYLVHLDNHAKPISSFLQDDLDNHRIAYRPPSRAYKDQRVHEVQFQVHDSHFAHSVPITLHVAVRPSDTTAPRVALLSGLVLLEGQSRPLTQRQLSVVDSDNPRRVRIYIKGGLHHGRVVVGGRATMIFTMDDVRNRRVSYQHDDSDSTKDRIELRISDGSHTVLSSFPITIIPKDDTPPYLINNLGMQVNEGGLQKIHEELLLAHDADSLDQNIIYTIVKSPRAGDLLRKIRPSDSGTKIFGFRQRDLLKGQVYYRHSGEEVFRDSFQFTLQDQQDPPNESEPQTFHILITPMNENPPQLSAEATRLMYVPETSVGYISQVELLYTDVESKPRELLYTVTTPPYLVYNRGERDAGRLITTHNVSNVNKQSSIPVAVRFTQADINHMKVAYIPPQADIGPESRLVRFAYTIEDSSGNKLYGQTFDIEVLPVNNQVPRFETDKLLVEEGGILGISISQLSASDADTLSTELSFMVDALPRFGTLQKEGRTLRKGAKFTLDDLRKKHIRYLHDGSDVTLDTFTLALTDGLNQETKVISVEIVPIDDQTPKISHDLRPLLIVSEGDEAVITPRILSATDEDTDDESLVFLIVKQPEFGVLQLRGQPATKVTQEQVKDGLVSYLHTSGEIGTSSKKDTVSFIVSDQNYLASPDLPLYDLNITITPVNNQKPVIQVGSPILVAEGESFRFSKDVVSVTDPDSKTKTIQFMITKQPQWGFIENTKPSPGSEKSNGGKRANSFSFGDILDGSINYVQANHRGVEPLSDEFQLYATDGKLNSEPKTVTITIVPANDEAPELMLKDFAISEGKDMIIDQSMVDAIDLDMPKDSLQFALSQLPVHGKLVMMINTKKGEVETEATDFSIDELHSGLKLKYKHDGSENLADKFAVTVSDGKHEIKRVCNVTIKLTNDEKPEVIKNAGLELDYGESALVSSVVLEARDGDNVDAELCYVILQLPTKGLLQYCPDPFSPTLDLDCHDIKVGQNFTQKDVDMNRVRYVHTTRMGLSQTDSFAFVLSDGTHRRHQETFEIKVRNSRKANIAVLNRGMTVREGERVAISTSNLSASDESTKADEIVFAVIRPPRLGQLEFIDSLFKPIRSFTQMDLAAQKVVYNHLTKNDITEDSFTFTVTNGLSEAKDGEFRIDIQPMDRVLPSLVSNNLIEVLQGGEEKISPYHLKAMDPDTATHNITFRVVKPPTYGQLFIRGGQVASSFTQNDVELGHVRYESDGSRAGLDNFLFSLSDGRHKGFLVNGTLQSKPAVVSIFIKPLVEDAPTLVTNKSPDTLQYFGRRRYGFRLNSKLLRVVDSDTDSGSLLYVMGERPRHGHIENTVAKRYVRRRFTQRDLDEDSLLFIIDPKTSATSDNFTFRVEDSRGNTLDDQRFDMSWSRVSFERKETVACENIGRLSVTLRRTGDLTQSAYVSIQVREVSATIGEDFIPSPAKQVQFDPGEAVVTWDLTIRDEGLEEKNEKLRLSLREPVNTIIGDRRKMGLRIINAVNGFCPQYLGMVSKFNDELTLSGPDPIPGTENRDRSRLLHKVAGISSSGAGGSRHENRYLNTQAEQKAERKDLFDLSTPTSVYSGKRKGKKKGKKGKRGKRGRRKRKNKRKNQVPLPTSPSSKAAPPTQSSLGGKLAAGARPSTAKYQPPQKCSGLTKGLLHFDNYNFQLMRCDGKGWQPWSPSSNNDERPTNGLCQEGWREYEQRCYLFVQDGLSWNAAERACAISHGAHLTSVRSMRHLRFLGEYAGKKSFWIGLNDKRQKSQWEYTNREDVTYSNWQGGAPRVKRRHHKKNCALVKNNLKWRNKRCNKYPARYVCEIVPSHYSSSVTPTSASLHSPAFRPDDNPSAGGKRKRKAYNRRRSRRNRKNLHEGFFYGE
ncbi:LOW QUALITY PROTEIN: FRAS1-related extracellular matrix protein 1-like [Babylonia areolata]|uniref:LOW QUALITY PROTEIN: FRAS1-related extracellular matrix protein 1-like n=1 Tax=Babylonia areolata TaxID=304850 RepID=UPI003FD43199